LLLAMGSSFDVLCGGSRSDALEERRGERGVERPSKGALGDGDVKAVRADADVRATAGQATGRVGEDLAGRRPNDPLELALRPGRPARDTGPRRDTTRRRRAHGSGGGYDATSSVWGSVSGVAFLV